MPFADAAKSYLEECTYGIRNKNGEPKCRQAANTDKRVLGCLTTRFAGRQLASITAADLDGFVLERSKETIPTKGTSPRRSTLNRDTATITGFFTFCIEKGWISSNPASSLEQKKENNMRLDKVVPKSDLVTWSRELQDHQPAHDIFLVLANTAMRFGECLALRCIDLRCDNNKPEVYIRDPKERRPCWIPVNDTVREILERRKAQGGEYLFPNPETGRPYSESGIRKAIYAARDRAKLSNHFVVHDLRRTAATRMMENGVALPVIQQLLRHVSLDTTMRYLGVSDSRRRDAVLTLDSMDVNNPRATLW
jgi:integrase